MRHTADLDDIWWTLFYAALTLAMLTTAWRSRSRGPVRQVGAILAVLYLISNLAYWFIHPGRTAFFPAIDAGCTCVVALLWLRGKATWLVVVTLLFLAETWAHVVYFNGPGADYPARYTHDLTLNLIYIAQLLTVTVHAWRTR